MEPGGGGYVADGHRGTAAMRWRFHLPPASPPHPRRPFLLCPTSVPSRRLMSATRRATASSRCSARSPSPTSRLPCCGARGDPRGQLHCVCKALSGLLVNGTAASGRRIHEREHEDITTRAGGRGSRFWSSGGVFHRWSRRSGLTMSYAGKLFNGMPLKMDNAHGVCCAMNYIQLIQSWIS